MVLFILRAILLILSTILILLTGGENGYYNRLYSQIVLWSLGISKIEVYGTLDQEAHVLAFNHPSYLDAFIMGSFVPYLGGLVRRSTLLDIYSKMTKSVYVGKFGGEQTSQRLKKAIRRNRKHKYAISVNTMDNKKNKSPGLHKGTSFQKFKTIPFVLDELVQPVLIVYDSEEYVISNLNGVICNLMRPMEAQNTVRIYLLPSDFKRVDETIESFVERTEKRMNWCLEKDWEKPKSINMSNTSRSIYIGLIFFIIALVALFKRNYEQSLMWFALSVITICYHQGQIASMYWLEKVMIALIIVKILFRYAVNRKPGLQ
jgi:hypothetical protein